MLEDYERAAMIPIDSDAPWHRFVRARFSGWLGNGRDSRRFAVEVHGAAQQSGAHADLSGLLEYGGGAALPVIYEFTGTLDLETREVRFGDAGAGAADRSYTGRFSENGRVLTLQSNGAGGQQGKPVHLIHEGTRRDLLGE